MAAVPEPRVEQLCQIYHPKKVTLAAIELVDTPGLSRTHEGNAARLAMIREAGCLVLVVAAFDGRDPVADIRSLRRRPAAGRHGDRLQPHPARVEISSRSPCPGRSTKRWSTNTPRCKIVLAAMESGKPLRESHMTDEQQKVTRASACSREKPRLVIVNTADDESQPERFARFRRPKRRSWRCRSGWSWNCRR